LLSSPLLGQYLRDMCGSPNSAYLSALSAAEGLGKAAIMCIPPEEASLLTLLSLAARPTVALEIGTFTGCSAAAIAVGMPSGSRLVSCDISKECHRIASQTLSGITHMRIDLATCSALDLLTTWNQDEPIDFAFIDGDKLEYVEYHEALVPLLSPGALMVVDNVCLHGNVANEHDCRTHVETMRSYNEHVKHDVRLSGSILPVADGMFVLYRRWE
jgi:caffeoyl-CoA O-methyltransferase